LVLFPPAFPLHWCGIVFVIGDFVATSTFDYAGTFHQGSATLIAKNARFGTFHKWHLCGGFGRGCEEVGFHVVHALLRSYMIQLQSLIQREIYPSSLKHA